MPTSTPTLQQLQRALSIAERIQTLEEELAGILGQDSSVVSGAGPSPAPRAASGKRGGKRVVSAEARARMAASQRARWAKQNGPAAAPAAKRGGRRAVSDEARARMSAAAKARHQKKNGSSAPSPAKAGKKKRVISPEARARIVAAVKARWAKVKKAL